MVGGDWNIISTWVLGMIILIWGNNHIVNGGTWLLFSPYIGNVIIPIDALVCFRAVGIPPTSYTKDVQGILDTDNFMVEIDIREIYHFPYQFPIIIYDGCYAHNTMIMIIDIGKMMAGKWYGKYADMIRTYGKLFLGNCRGSILHGGKLSMCGGKLFHELFDGFYGV